MEKAGKVGKVKKRVSPLWDDAPLLGSKAALEKTKKRKPSQWVRLENAEAMAERRVVNELKAIAIAFATHPDKQWTSEEIAEYLHNRMARRRKNEPMNSVDEDQLPRGHQKRVYFSG